MSRTLSYYIYPSIEDYHQAKVAYLYNRMELEESHLGDCYDVEILYQHQYPEHSRPHNLPSGIGLYTVDEFERLRNQATVGSYEERLLTNILEEMYPDNICLFYY